MRGSYAGTVLLTRDDARGICVKRTALVCFIDVLTTCPRSAERIDFQVFFQNFDINVVINNRRRDRDAGKAGMTAGVGSEGGLPMLVKHFRRGI